MTSVLFLVFRTLFITMMTVGMMASLTEFRFGPRKLLLILGGYSLWVLGSTGVLLWLGGELLLLRLFYLTISVPATILTYWAANDTPIQAVFNYMTQILVSILGVGAIRLLTERLGLPGLANLAIMVVFYGTVIYLERRFLRRPFRVLIQMIPSGWGVLTLIPCVFCAYFVFVASWPVWYLNDPSQAVYVYAAVIPLVIVYVAVFKSLSDLYHIQQEQQNATLLKVQITALKEKMNKSREVEESIRIQRHDLRHQFQTAAELVARGERQAALDFLAVAQHRLDEQQVVRWCAPPVLDAVFSSYFNQARAQDIQVEAKISLPAGLPVDEGELAIVLANALENAIHANLALPPKDRQIRCKMIASPSVMLEISNPCADGPLFDRDGLPVARREGHGLGVQSISAFCKKNGAICQFDHQDGWFRFRLVL